MKNNNNLPQARNYAFDGLKLLFVLIIVVHHSHYLDNYLFHGYIGVEFFFIASGYMLMRTTMIKPELSSKHYMFQRLKRIYPHYLFSFFVYFLLMMVYKFRELNFSFFFKGITEVLMIQNLGIFSGGYNYPCWYISVLFYASIFVYFLWKHLPSKVFYIIGICCSIVVYGYILYFNNGILETWDTHLIFYLPFWRGISGIIVGMLIYMLHQKINFKKYSFLFLVSEIISLILILVLMCIPQNIDMFIFLSIILLVISIGSPYSLISKLSNISIVSIGTYYEYSIFLNHAFIIAVFDKIINIFPKPIIVVKLPILILAIIIYSIITTKLVDRFMKYIKLHKDTI